MYIIIINIIIIVIIINIIIINIIIVIVINIITANTIVQHRKMSNPKEIKIEKTELAREITMEEIESLKIYIERLEDL